MQGGGTAGPSTGAGAEFCAVKRKSTVEVKADFQATFLGVSLSSWASIRGLRVGEGWEGLSWAATGKLLSAPGLRG